MIIKVQDDALDDRFLIEAMYINWFYPKGENYVILEVHVRSEQIKRSGSISVSHSGIEDEPSQRLRVYHGDRVYIMNDAGKTIDSKRIDLIEEAE